jgi:transglutaminase-like putative cysteine protease
MWSVLLWLVGAWAGWHLRRNYQALRALAPGGVIMAVVLDTRHEDVGILIVYLAALLALIGLSRVNWMHLRWRQQQVSYSDSVRLETLGMVGVVTIALVLSAAGAPSLSWREWWEKVREKDRATETGDFEPLDNVANSAAYRSGGLPRSHLLSASPELLQEVVMTVSTGELPPIPETVLDIDPNRYYWRAITYDVYSGLGWDSSAAQDISLPPNTPLLASPPAYRVLTQHIKQTQSSTKLYWTGILAQVDTEINIAWRTRPSSDPDTLQYGDMLGALSDSDEYTVESYVPEFSAEQLQSAGSDYPPEIVGRYLQLPDTTPERVIALARELTQAAPTPYDRAAAIEAYLRTFPYTLEVEPPPPGRDVVDYFLFTARQGYCDYYATSMVVLARAVGLPARLVIGYASGDYNAPTAEYIVRQEDAHSWVEIYFAGFGWVEFEPTASQAAIDRGGDVNASAPPPGLPGGSSAFSWLMDQWRSLISSLGGQILVVGLGFILFLTLWQAGEFSYLNLISSRRAISRMYTRLERAALYLLPDLPDGHTPHQLGMALELKLKGTNHRLLKSVFSNAGNEVEQVISLFVSQVFSGHPPSNAQTRAGIRAWMLLRWRLWVAKRWI